MKDCIFCRIVSGELPSNTVGETKNVIAFKNINPVAQYHVLITPKTHIESFLSLAAGKKEILSEMVELAQKLIKDNEIENGYKLAINGGKYQQIKHFHWHLLGGEMYDKNDVLDKT